MKWTVLGIGIVGAAGWLAWRWFLQNAAGTHS